MTIYGRIQNGVVAELVTTDLAISTMFNPALTWVDLTSQPGVAAGWLWNGTQATAPVATAEGGTVSPMTLAELQSQITTLQTRLAALTSTTVAGAGS